MGGTKLGIVLPAYQAERFLAATLDSLRAQPYTDWTCVIVDDGSTDGTGRIADEVAARDSRFHVLRQTNRGPSAARNAGIRHLDVGTEYLALLDSDDLYEGDALGKLVRALDARAGAIGAYGLAEYVDGSGAPVLAGTHPRYQRDRPVARGWRLTQLPPRADSTFADLVHNSPVWPAIVGVLRWSAVCDVGLFDESIPVHEDWDLMLRLARLGPLVALDEQVAWYRRHDANLTLRNAEGRYQNERVLWKAWHDPRNSAAERALLRRGLVWYRVRTVRMLLTNIRGLLRRGHHRAAARAGFGLLWTLVAALRTGPMRPDVRRMRMALGLAPGQPEDALG